MSFGFPPDCASRANARWVGDPVDTLTGAVFDGKLEFRLIGPLELWWWRHYDSSQHRRRFALGWGHTHDFDRSLHFDIDGMRYEAPLGRTVGFPPLRNDGDEDISQGFRIRRVSVREYQLFHHGQPAMEFRFHHPAQPAPLRRLFQGRHEIVFQYDARVRLRRVVDSAGRSLLITTADDGRLVEVSLEQGRDAPATRLLRYEYDECGNAVRAIHASGHGYTFAYDDENRMVRRTGRKGFSFYFTYDGQGRCRKATGDDRLYEVTLEYVVSGRVTRVTRADGGIWTYLFDQAGGLAQIHDPLGGVEQFVRDDSGRVTARLDPCGNATRVLYDAAGAAVAEVSPFGYRFSLPRDPNAPDPLRHRVAANAAEYEYGRLLDLRTVQLPREQQALSLPLPAESRRVLSYLPEMPVLPEPNRRFDVRPLGVRWWPKPERDRFFDDFGKLVSQADDAGRLRKWTYDAAGNVAGYTDFDGATWSYHHGSWHFLQSVSSPIGAHLRFSYTRGGRVASCTDTGGTRSEYRYDSKDQLIEVRRHGRVRDTYTRDAAGNLVAKHAADGRELLKLEIGAAGLPVKRTLASGDQQTLEYDDSGRCIRAATLTCSVAFAYDAFGNQRLDTRNGLGVEHRFSGRNRLLESIVFGRFVIRYARGDSALRIADPGGQSHVIRCLSHGVVERCFANGSSELAQYDPFGRCLVKRAQRAHGSVWVRRFHWSGEGDLARIDDSRRGLTRHEYDRAHRLRRRILPDRREEIYEFDLADNLLRQPGMEQVEIQEGNRLKTVNGLGVAYNDRNHLTFRDSPRGPVRYEYDSRDLLVRVENSEGNWTASYDVLRRRTRKTWAGSATEYYWNGDQLTAELRPGGAVRLYVYPDPLALTPFLLLDYDSLESAPASCRRYYVFADQIGTPCLIEDEQRRSVWEAQIEPFGRAAIAAGSEIECNLRFPGHYCDAEIGLHYNRFRYYDPSLARYVESDPWGIAGGHNLYAYRTNPLLEVDVRGLGEENDPACRPQADEETPAGPPATPDNDAPPVLPRLTREQGQAICDEIHAALNDPQAQVNRTTGLTELEDGRLAVTSSDQTNGVTPDQRQRARELLGPLGFGDDDILFQNERGNPGYVRPGERNLEQTPDPNSSNHAEQRGIQVGEEQGSPAIRQWASSDSPDHEGAACHGCEQAQQGHGVRNETGFMSEGGRYDQGGAEPPENQEPRWWE